VPSSVEKICCISKEPQIQLYSCFVLQYDWNNKDRQTFCKRESEQYGQFTVFVACTEIKEGIKMQTLTSL